MIPARKIDVLISAYAAGANDPAILAIVAALGIPHDDFVAWKRLAHSSIAAAERDFDILCEAETWRRGRGV